MNILHITHGLYAGNGLETFLANLINNLNCFNHYVVIFKNRNKDNIGLSEKVKIIEIESLFEVKDIVENKKIDVINIHWTGPESFNNEFMLLGFNGRYFVNKKGNFTIDDDPYGYLYISRFWNPYLENDNYEYLLDSDGNKIKNPQKPFTIITCHSDFKIPTHVMKPDIDVIVSVSNKTMKNQAHTYTEHKVIYNGVDTNRFRPQKQKIDISNNKLSVGWIGRMDKYESFVYEAIKENEFINSICDFYFIGSGKLDDNPPKNFKFLGTVKNPEYYLQQWDIFLYPTRIDSFGLAVVEAMSCELPIIASSEVREVLGDTGLIYKNTNDLIENFSKLINFENMRKSLGKDARKRVLANFSLEKMLKEYKNLYEKTTLKNKNS